VAPRRSAAGMPRERSAPLARARSAAPILIGEGRDDRQLRGVCHRTEMVALDRRLDRAKRQTRRGLTRIGEEFREARLAAALTQREVGAAIGISHAEISRIERGTAERVPYEALVMVAATLGLDLPLRSFPGGEAIRDVAQVGLLGRLRAVLAPALTWRSEVPLEIPGDLRAWDAVIGGRGWTLPVDAESRLRDIQALSRRLALKRRDGRVSAMVLLIANTRHNRSVLRVAMPDLVGDFPLPGPAILRELEAGLRPPASGIVLLRSRSRPTSDSDRIQRPVAPPVRPASQVDRFHRFRSIVPARRERSAQWGPKLADSHARRESECGCGARRARLRARGTARVVNRFRVSSAVDA
jgi:transcriptional regulator with XRE-family HTH domain